MHSGGARMNTKLACLSDAETKCKDCDVLGEDSGQISKKTQHVVSHLPGAATQASVWQRMRPGRAANTKDPRVQIAWH